MDPEVPKTEEAAPVKMTQAEIVAKIKKQQDEAFDKADHAERLTIAMRRGLINPCIEYTLDELKALVPLKRDRYRLIKFAVNRFGLYAGPRPKGKKKPHMSLPAQRIKSASLLIFQRLFKEKAENLEAVCGRENIKYIGVPESAIPEIGARAANLALGAVADDRKRKRKVRRRMQQFQRKVNAGILPGNTGERNYSFRGGEYGR